MIFTSKHAGLMFRIRDPLYNYNTPTGMPPQEIRPALWADFGGGYGVELMSGEFHDSDGYAHADIRGGVFDTDEAATRLSWLPEEKLLVEETMGNLAADPRFNDFALWSKPAPAKAPLPNYDRLSEKRLVMLASELDVVEQVLAYERSNGNRPDVVEPLEHKLEAEKQLVAQ